MLPDGAIFCGECGRAVTAAASRRPAVPTPIEQAPPPPLQQPDLHGRRQEPATDAWLPESTLDPATRAWLTGGDRAGAQPPAVPVQRPDDHAPRSAPTHVHRAESGLRHPGDDGSAVGQQSSPAAVEPDLDPNAYPSVEADGDDPEVTHVSDQPTVPVAPAPSLEPVAPVWAPPVQQEPAPAPAGPSWWIDRSSAAPAAQPGGATSDPDDGSVPETETAAPAAPAAAGAVATDIGTTDDPSASDGADGTNGRRAAGDDSAADPADDERSAGPRPGDTAVVEPLVDRRPRRPMPLVAPGSQGTVCHVCGHTLEPDDIFCAECGAVRPAVTAAFTGPIVPLPMDRPDWAADHSATVPFAGAAERAELDTADETADRDDADVDEPDDEIPLPGEHTGDADGAAAVDVLPGPTSATDDVQAEAEVSPFWVPGSATIPSSAPSAGDTPAPDAGAGDPTGTPMAGSASTDADTSGLVLALPTTDDAPTSADGDDDDVEATRIVSKAPTSAPFVLHFSTGERFGVDGSGLVGRLPRAQPGERFDDLLTVHDPGKSVSKTHLELGRDGDDLWVSDRFSGNGTVVRHIDGSIRRCEPGRRYRVERGARVDIGEQFFLVQ